MKLVIPMSGKGSRFLAAGYKTPKPLIEVEGKSIIAHVLDMFPGVEEVIFVCNESHLTSTPMKAILMALRPDATIISAPQKLGPVFAVMQAFDHINDEEDVMVSYCDFTQIWDFEGFRNQIKNSNVSGAVTAYTGFHPHLLKRNLYAGIITDESARMQKIQEKHCFTENPEDSHHSSGAYYFGSGAILKHYFNQLVDSGQTLNDEYYVSMVYPLMLQDGLVVTVPSVKRFMQWGTPEDLEEYEAWSRHIHNKINREKLPTNIPTERYDHVRIPYERLTDEFQCSYKYWKDHFLNI